MEWDRMGVVREVAGWNGIERDRMGQIEVKVGRGEMERDGMEREG